MLTVSAFVQLVAAFALEAVASAKEGLRHPIRAFAPPKRFSVEKLIFYRGVSVYNFFPNVHSAHLWAVFRRACDNRDRDQAVTIDSREPIGTRRFSIDRSGDVEKLM